MGFKTLFKKGMNKVKDVFDEQKMIDRASKLREEFDRAVNEKQPWNDKFDREEAVYVGDRDFGNTYGEPKDSARTLIKLVYMLNESEIDLSIPEPIFKPISQDDEEPIKKLQSMANYTVRSNALEKINSVSERETKKYGTTVYKILWNSKYRGGGQIGRCEIISVHPKNIYLASGTVDIEKCEAIYHVENETLARCIKTYGDISRKLPIHGLVAESKYDEVGKTSDSNVNNSNDTLNTVDLFTRPTNHPLSKYTIIEKWYFDEEGDVCLLVFSGNLILLETPKFYYRRDNDGKNIKYDKEGKEELITKYEMEDDYVVVKDEEGKEYKETKIKKGEMLSPYIPKSLPFVFQVNVPRSKCVWGISNSEIIYDIDQSIKKIIHKHEERILNGTSKILYDKNQEEGAAQLLNNVDLQIVPVNDVNNFKVVELKADDNYTIQFYNLLIDIAQRMLGINNVWQGVNKGEATSGKMAEALIRQTGEKINIKVNEKNIAYKKLYKMVCDFLLTFSDGEMPYRLDSKFKPEYGKFNKYDVIRKDKSDNWIYPNFDIEISAEQGFPKTTTFLFDSVVQLAKQGFLEPTPVNVMVWTLLSKIGFPNSESILQDLQEQTQQAQQPMGIPGQPQQSMPSQQPVQQGATMGDIVNMLPKELQQQFLSMSPEEQLSALGGK